MFSKLLRRGSSVFNLEENLVQINLLAPASGELLRAEGRVVKHGKRLVVVTSEIHTLKEDKKILIAIMQGTMIPVPVKL